MRCYCLHRAAGAIVFDGIFGQVEQQPVDQCIAAHHGGITAAFQCDVSFFRQRGKIGADLLQHGRKLDLILARHLLQVAHFQQSLGHLGQALGLLLQKAEKLCGFRLHLGMLGRKQLHLRLHQRQRRAQLVGGIAGKLPLGRKAVVQAFQHLVEGSAELPEFRQHILAELHVCQIVQLHFFGLCGKAAQRLEGVPTDKIGQYAAEQRYACRYVPVGCAELLLRPVDHDGDILPGACLCRVKAGRLGPNGKILNGLADGIHIIYAGKAKQQFHANAGCANEQNRHQGDAPLQGKPLHVSSPPIR